MFLPLPLLIETLRAFVTRMRKYSCMFTDLVATHFQFLTKLLITKFAFIYFGILVDFTYVAMHIGKTGKEFVTCVNFARNRLIRYIIRSFMSSANVSLEMCKNGIYFVAAFIMTCVFFLKKKTLESIGSTFISENSLFRCVCTRVCPDDPNA